jgi:UDP-glucose 4-epimerase
VYNVACGERVTINGLIAELRELLGSSVEADYRPPRPGEVPHSLADISAARRELGYEPAVALRDGLERTIEHLRGEVASASASV